MISVWFILVFSISAESGNSPFDTKWIVGLWGMCSTQCGIGRRFRDVTCAVYVPFQYIYLPVNSSLCQKEPKPPSSIDCNSGDCDENTAEGYYWRLMWYSKCDAECLGGTSYPVFYCVNKKTAQFMPDNMCSQVTRPRYEPVECNTFPCEPWWVLNETGSCSSTCGPGYQKLSYICYQKFKGGMIISIPNKYCSQPPPQGYKDCNGTQCKVQWKKSEWSLCTDSCERSISVQRRQCVLTGDDNSSNTEILGENKCPWEPVYIRECPRRHLCKNGLRMYSNESLTQLAPLQSPLVIDYQDILHLRPNTRIELRCSPDTENITWANEIGLVSFKHTITVETDKNTIFRCTWGGGIYKEFTIRVEDKSELNLSYIRNLTDNYGVLVKSSSILTYLVTNWSSCSVICGVGDKKRTVFCGFVSNQFYISVPNELCEDIGLRRPPHEESCSSVCPQWKLSPWSSCSEDNCFDFKKSINIRTSRCVDWEDNLIDPQLCSKPSPVTVRVCHNELCTFQWFTKEWSKCEGDCSSAFQERNVYCAWNTTNRAYYWGCGVFPPENRRKCVPNWCLNGGKSPNWCQRGEICNILNN